MRVTRWPTLASGEEWGTRSRLRGRELHSAWGQFLGRVRWQTFATLTFDPDKVYPVGHMKAEREAFWWCGQTGRLLRRPVGWIYAAERGRCGQWHVHALVIGGLASELKGASMMWEERNGRIDCRDVTDATGVSLYTSKQAALHGNIVLSDTLARYREAVHTSETVRLHP